MARSSTRNTLELQLPEILGALYASRAMASVRAHRAIGARRARDKKRTGRLVPVVRDQLEELGEG